MFIEHVAYNVPEPAAAADWYIEHLGFRLLRRNDAEPFENFIASSGGQVIELYRNPRAELPDYAAMSPFTLHIAFATDDLDATRARLLEAGATAVDEPTATPTGDRLAFVRDPWGVPLQLATRAAPLQ